MLIVPILFAFESMPPSCFLESLSPSSELRSASPLKGEAVKYANLAQVTASPLRGEAARRADEGDRDIE